MESHLSCEEIKTRFSHLSNAEDVADILNVSYRWLCYRLYVEPAGKRYSTFTIPKKSGGERVITAPNTALKALQRRLCQVLACVYEPKPVVHGFTHERGIRTNAAVHAASKYILNVDLLDFFPSINFGRVRGMFMARPYSCTERVATVLAQICCHNNQLPQGAPTSPIVSNMLCARMDSHLRQLARRHRCSYTRYADDLTFSTDRSQFPQELAILRTEDGKQRCVPGAKLVRVIESNGFSINQSKVRLQTRHGRQEVTGLVTNRVPNVKREFVREVRGLLHNWETKGLDECQQRYHASFARRRHHNPETPPPLFKAMVKGKIEYLGMVRGKGDFIYRKFLRRLAALSPELVNEAMLRDDGTSLLDHLWVILSENVDDRDAGQGTGFYLKDYGLVTCAHVLGDELSEGLFVKVQSRDLGRKHFAKVVAYDRALDLAILDTGVEMEFEFEAARDVVRIGEPIKLAGFPNHGEGHSGIVAPGFVTGFRRDVYKNELTLISANIIAGNSGGPVFNASGKVIGVAVRGAKSQDEAQETEFHGVVPIALLSSLRPRASDPKQAAAHGQSDSAESSSSSERGSCS